ncbi:MAG: hypothetical protein RL625_282 [Gemmatimonadota bacterium]|jgi:sigma-B regulation protein RsbU (phosphoserine phosphatase)
MSQLGRVLEAFAVAQGGSAVIWMASPRTGQLDVVAAAGGEVTPPEPTLLAADATITERSTALGPQWIMRVPGRTAAWLGVGAVPGSAVEVVRWVPMLAEMLSPILQSQWEAQRATDELAERYEEINLLYSISDILGRTVTLEQMARTILMEVAETVGAEYGAIHTHDPASGVLRPVATLRLSPAVEAIAIPTDHPVSVPARVFRTRNALLVDAGVLESEHEAAFREGALLSVPINWTAPGGGVTLGVVSLSGRRGGAAFTAGDEKLVAAVGSQIGTAIQNARLVRASVERERLESEMRLAHDLQLKLLPAGQVVAPEALCAARVEAAEGVGGDFYHLFRLDEGRTGILIGDVSGHGYRAALIMALVMSAAAIHARTTSDPARTVEALLATVADELRETEMFLSLCYAIVDHARGEIQWTNTGHPHAFVIDATGTAHRLQATDPPLGLGSAALQVRSRPWDRTADLLALFTDGVSDARDQAGHPLGEAAVLRVLAARRREVPSRIIDGVFSAVEGHMGRVPPHDDQAVVVLRSA